MEQITPETIHWAERGGFAVAFFLLAWWVKSRIDRTEDRQNLKIDTLESYIRNELAELVTNCTQALNKVHSFLNGDKE